MTEAELQTQVADYLRLQYPNVIFRSDYGSGAKLSWAQAKRQKRQNGGRRAWPDMLLAEPRDVVVGQKPVMVTGVLCQQDITEHRCGLFIELKKAGTRIYKKDGTLTADEHIQEQAKMLEALRKRGYKAEFACGFDEAKRIIDEYLS